MKEKVDILLTTYNTNIEYLKEQESLNLEIASEFLVMASTLLYLKSKNLLPKQEEEQEEDIWGEEQETEEIQKVDEEEILLISDDFVISEEDYIHKLSLIHI